MLAAGIVEMGGDRWRSTGADTASDRDRTAAPRPAGANRTRLVVTH
jgi:hypothetical protein